MIHNKRLLIFFLLSLFFVIGSMVSVAKQIKPFVHQRGFYSPSLFDTSQAEHAISHLFENTAHIANAKTHQVHVSMYNDYFDYDEFSFSYVVPIKDRYSIGIAYHSFYTQDIQRTAIDTSALRGVAVLDTFSDIHSKVVLGLGLKATNRLALGTRFHYIERKLDNESLTQFTGDLGLSYRLFNTLYVGAYTQNMIQGRRKWTASQTSELLDEDIIFEIQGTYKKVGLRFSTDQTLYRMNGNWLFNDYLTFTGDMILAQHNEQNRQSIGIILSLNTLSFHYSYLHYHKSLGMRQHLFGLLFSFGNSLLDS